MKKTKVMASGARNILENRIFGEEPVFPMGHQLSKMELIQAYNWYNYRLERSDATTFIKNYFKKRHPSIYSGLNKTKCGYLLTSICWAARMIDNGYLLPTGTENKIIDHVKDVISRYGSEPEVISLADRSKEKVDNTIADIEDMIDTDKPFSVYEYLGKNTVPKSCVDKVLEYYTPILNELVEARTKKNDQLKQAYSHLSAKSLKERIDVFQGIVDDCTRFTENKKIVRKPRKKKTVSVEKKTQKVQYLEKFDEYQLVSKPATAIIGAKEVWLFNGKYKTITRLVSDDGFDIKGTTIVNINMEQSAKKTTGRKSKEIVDSVLKAGKVQMRKLMDNIKGTISEPTGRINKDVLILRTS